MKKLLDYYQKDLENIAVYKAKDVNLPIESQYAVAIKKFREAANNFMVLERYLPEGKVRWVRKNEEGIKGLSDDDVSYNIAATEQSDYVLRGGLQVKEQNHFTDFLWLGVSTNSNAKPVLGIHLSKEGEIIFSLGERAK